MRCHILSLCFAALLFNMFPVAAQQSYKVTFSHTGLTVYGTFTTPEGTGPFPTILINPGSGQLDRDGTVFVFGGNFACLYPGLLLQTLKPYRDLSDALVDSGYAVLRYDKIEYTYQNIDSITFRELWLPVESAFDFVRTRPDVDTNRIILIGHSEGAALIPVIANSGHNIRALISIAGARTPFDSILARQIVDIAERCGGDTTLAKLQASQILAYFHMIRTQSWNTTTPAFAGVEPDVWYDYLSATDPVAENYNTAGLPALFLGLEQDFNVPPSELARMQQDVTISEDFWSIPGLNHFMTTDQNPFVSEVLTDTIIFWLRHLGLSTQVQPEPQETFQMIDVYPNPFTSRLKIRFISEEVTPVLISITDSTGNLVYHSEEHTVKGVNLYQPELHSLPSGTYLLMVRSGNKKYSTPLVKDE